MSFSFEAKNELCRLPVQKLCCARAEAYGIQGERAATQPEFEAAFRRAVAAGRPYLIECAIDKDAMVHPMVPGGAPATEFLLD